MEARHGMGRGILLVYAHPDDECFGTGGASQMYSAMGDRVELAVATDGEAGSLGDPPITTREDLGRVRREETLGAARHLGIEKVHWLGLPDGKVAFVDHRGAVEKLVRIMRTLRPAVVVTFGPEGAGNRHADHQATCLITTRAFFQAGLPFPGVDLEPFRPLKLYYHAWPADLGVVVPGVVPQPITTELDVSPYLEGKFRAFREHRTQAWLYDRFSRIMKATEGKEHFHLVHTEGKWPEVIESDLFEGIARVPGHQG